MNIAAIKFELMPWTDAEGRRALFGRLSTGCPGPVVLAYVLCLDHKWLQGAPPVTPACPDFHLDLCPNTKELRIYCAPELFRVGRDVAGTLPPCLAATPPLTVVRFDTSSLQVSARSCDVPACRPSFDNAARWYGDRWTEAWKEWLPYAESFLARRGVPRETRDDLMQHAFLDAYQYAKAHPEFIHREVQLLWRYLSWRLRDWRGRDVPRELPSDQDGQSPSTPTAAEDPADVVEGILGLTPPRFWERVGAVLGQADPKAYAALTRAYHDANQPPNTVLSMALWLTAKHLLSTAEYYVLFERYLTRASRRQICESLSITAGKVRHLQSSAEATLRAHFVESSR